MQKRGESEKIFRTAVKSVTGGVHSSFRYRIPHPIYFERARGSKLWDVDGNEYIDCLVNNGACILGHKDAAVTLAVQNQLESGLTVGLESRLSVEVAQKLNRMIPSAESVKFSNSGTEAVMHAIQIARGYTGRKMIIKFEGCYDGWSDEMNVSVHPRTGRTRKRTWDAIPETEGAAPELSAATRVVPYNNIASLRDLVKENRSKFAALIIEPVMFNSGCVLPKEGFLEEVRAITEEHNILLIFDEVITGFRMSPGGAQEYYHVVPDISVFGKAIANGFPLSAVVGRKEVMAVTTPDIGGVLFAGTYNANQPSLAAAKATLEQLESGEVQRRLDDNSSKLSKKFNTMADEMGVIARMIAISGKFQVYFTEEEIWDYAAATKSDSKKYAVFTERAMELGVLMSQSRLFHHGISAAHSRRDIQKIENVFEQSLAKILRGSSTKN